MNRKITEGKVSIIIPVYNGAAWIEECLKSVISQTWENFEALVLDDHSTDGTTQMVREMSQKDQRIQLILRDGRGVSAARNQGIEQSGGEYITFLDADDKLDNRMLERMIRYLKEENSDMVSCGYHKWTSDFREDNKEDSSKETVRTVDKQDYVEEYFLCRHTHCWGVLYKRTVIGDVRFREDLTIGEDMMFLADLLPKLSRISMTEYKGYYYRINEAGVTLRPFVPAYMDEIKSWKLAAEIIRKDYPQCRAQVESILAVSGILVAGKIAALPNRDRKKYGIYVKECRKTVKDALKAPGARKNLPAGYGIKTTIFMLCPWVYLKMYHLWKCR